MCNSNGAWQFGSSQRTSHANGGKKSKGTNKNPDQSEHFYIARMDADAAIDH